VATGAMQTVPISTQSMMMNTTDASEFTADSQDVGLFWIVLNSNPTHSFEAFQLYYLPGMSMQNAMMVASATFPMSNMAAVPEFNAVGVVAFSVLAVSLYYSNTEAAKRKLN
jgi:hypothetical protein